MSASDEKISSVVGGGGDDDDDDGEDEDEYDVAAIGKNHSTRIRRKDCGCGGFAKESLLRQFSKAKRKLRRVKSKRVLLPSSSSENASSSGSGKNNNNTRMIIRDDDIDSGSRSGCKFCFSKPKVLESPDGSPISDPNDPKFTQVMLTTLIEKNDFYSKECNPHIN